MNELLAHLFGDYILQSDWMAQNKMNRSFACLCHVLTYTLPFLFLTTSVWALLIIASTHFVIDRWRLAKYIVFAKNFLAPLSAIKERTKLPRESMEQEFVEYIDKYSWENCKGNGYPSETPIWLSTWLFIIADNSLHLLCNHLALAYFGK